PRRYTGGKVINDIIAVCVFAHGVSSKKIPGVSRFFLARLSAAGLRQCRWAGRYGVPAYFPSVKIGVKQLLLCCHNISQCHPGCVNINQVRPVHYKRLAIIIHQRAETRRRPHTGIS
ncbi:hypothetical protein LNP26_29880, partial [Klebsiella variicola subsp. variicola]|nr:hypothetical protein [Klebsiella variicola subsp. variicola]